MIEVVFAELLFWFKFLFEGFIVFLFLLSFLDSNGVDIVFIVVVVDIVVVREDKS
jgi:hypothetical protein